jgi:hypothetical protein
MKKQKSSNNKDSLFSCYDQTAQYKQPATIVARDMMSLQNPLHILTASKFTFLHFFCVALQILIKYYHTVLPKVEQENYIPIPGDLVREIFSHLVLRDIVQCGLVCKAWHNHSADLSYLNNLDLSHLKVQDPAIFFD